MKSTNFVATLFNCSDTGPAPGGTCIGGNDRGPVGGRGCREGMLRPPDGAKGEPRAGPGMRISGEPELPGLRVCGGGCGMPGRNPGPLILGAPKMLASEPIVEMGG